MRLGARTAPGGPAASTSTIREVAVRTDATHAQQMRYVRIGVALFSTADEVDRCLEVTRRLV
jgi:hypothetical protein